MNKLFSSIGAIAALALAPQFASAQQTLEEATDSIKNVLALAKKGEATAQNEIGMWYYVGRHVKQDYKEALQWWARSAKQGNVKAIGNMGICYQYGRGIEADSLMASQLYLRSIKDGNTELLSQNEKLANDGNIFSDMLIAECYQKGIGVKKDVEKAIPYLMKAADKNSAIAQRDLGLLLLNSKKSKEAATWFKKGADAGNLTCNYYYGKMLLDGLGMKQDKNEGANYLLKAAEAGFPQAMYMVGNCYMEGEGLTKNAEQALKWYRLGAGKGSHLAQWALAQCLREGKGTPVNYDQALYWYAEAVAKGHKSAFKNLVTDSIPSSPFIAYMKGMKAYGNKDFDEALKQFKIVEKAKVTDGKVMTAVIMANIEYTKHNVKKAIKLLNEVSETDARALYLLGTIYEAGKGVEKDMTQAIADIQKSAELGYAPAECALADIYFEGRGLGQSYEKAVEWYEKADSQGQLSENAAKRYASCYDNGRGGLSPDKAKAEEILKRGHTPQISKLLELI